VRLDLLRRERALPAVIAPARRGAAAVALAIGTLLAACGGDGGGSTCAYQGHTYQADEVWPAGDGCNTCHCTSGSFECSLIACDQLPDASPTAPACGASGGCPGPACGAVCCRAGERCVDGACRCGANPGCGPVLSPPPEPYDSCAAAGPVGVDECGAVCCSTNCPL